MIYQLFSEIGLTLQQRGPRLYAFSIASAALGEVLADRERFPIKKDEFRFEMTLPKDIYLAYQPYELTVNKVNLLPIKGQVESVKKVDDGVLVTFKAVTMKVWNRICTPTKRIDRILPDGTVHYEHECHVGTPNYLSETTKEAPIVVPAEVADGIKVGSSGHWYYNINGPDKPRQGAPHEVYSDPALKKLGNWFGVPL